VFRNIGTRESHQNEKNRAQDDFTHGFEIKQILDFLPFVLISSTVCRKQWPTDALNCRKANKTQ